MEFKGKGRVYPLKYSTSVFPLVSQLYPQMSEAQCAQRFERIMTQGNYQLLLAHTEAGEVVAMCGVWMGTKLWCGKYLELDNLVVAPDYRGQGISRRMMDFALNYAKEQQCEAIALDVFQHNDAANGLYDKARFESPGFHRMLWLNDANRTIGMGLKLEETAVSA